MHAPILAPDIISYCATIVECGDSRMGMARQLRAIDNEQIMSFLASNDCASFRSSTDGVCRPCDTISSDGAS